MSFNCCATCGWSPGTIQVSRDPGGTKRAATTMDLDVSGLLGMSVPVVVRDLPVAICLRCGATTVRGEVLDAVALHFGASLLERYTLSADEARYLRRLAGDTPEELARAIGVEPPQVITWEMKQGFLLAGATAYAVRAYIFFRLFEKMDKRMVTFFLRNDPGTDRRSDVDRSSSGYEVEASEIDFGTDAEKKP